MKISTPQQTQDMDALIYVLSHDLRAPARALRQYCTLLEKELEGTDSSDRCGHFVDRLVQVLEGMDSQIDGLLELSRVDKAKSDPTTIDIQTLFERLLSERDLRGAVEGELPSVRAPLDQVERLFGELLDNVAHHAGTEPTVSLSSDDQGFYLSDDGNGIPDPIREEAFVVFRPIAPHGSPRRGLGLNLCRRIVQSWGGTIALETSKHEGACVFFTLPIQENG